MDIEKLWEAACSGDMETLKEYYEKGEGIIDIRYEKFRTNHSLIMGAFRNSQFETVEYLLSVGESITYEERKEVQKELNREIAEIEKPSCPSVLKGHKWNQKVYGKSGSYSVYPDGEKSINNG